jgi:muconolactone delta-isomerase
MSHQYVCNACIDRVKRSLLREERGIVHMKFIVSASFRTQDQEEMLALVPQERAHIQVLQEQGTIEALYHSADYLHVWVVMREESQDQVQKALEAFPLYPYVREVAIAPLL